MAAGGFAGEYAGEENALIELDAVLVALQVLGLGRDLRCGRRQARDGHGRGEDQVFQPNESRALVRQLVVERLGMGGEELFALLARGGENRLCRARLTQTSRRLLRQAAEQIGAELPVPRIAPPIDIVIAGSLRRGRGPFGNRALIEAGGLQLGCRHGGIDTHRANPFNIQLFGRRSMTRLALPCERSIAPGSSTRTAAVTPT